MKVIGLLPMAWASPILALITESKGFLAPAANSWVPNTEQEAGGRRQEAGGRRQEAGGRRRDCYITFSISVALMTRGPLTAYCIFLMQGFILSCDREVSFAFDQLKLVYTRVLHMMNIVLLFLGTIFN